MSAIRIKNRTADFKVYCIHQRDHRLGQAPYQQTRWLRSQRWPKHISRQTRCIENIVCVKHQANTLIDFRAGTRYQWLEKLTGGLQSRSTLAVSERSMERLQFGVCNQTGTLSQSYPINDLFLVIWCCLHTKEKSRRERESLAVHIPPLDSLTSTSLPHVFKDQRRVVVPDKLTRRWGQKLQ